MKKEFKGYITYRCYKCEEKYCVVRIKAGEELPTVCPYLLIKCKWEKKAKKVNRKPDESCTDPDENIVLPEFDNVSEGWNND